MNTIQTPLDMNSAEQYRQLELALEIYRESICRGVSSIRSVDQLYFYFLAFLSLELYLKQIATNSALSSLAAACGDDKGCILARKCGLNSCAKGTGSVGACIIVSYIPRLGKHV